ncbi:MAG: ATP/ADP translocase [Candidatus Improbicoccus pseudotrichonymphae]|uniref:ADP,ATP carrier protein n=1 Tax=Candidatus Improbicoccus pseudotrichonymphae TaxID=3033792 RepID=A0AA48HXJ3_9FIRM|nr:MAG: ATP/ADP translocase [Candidatus Improbicoccus pseudotrichonymphae]
MPEATKIQKFGKIRSILWPIHNFELKKILPMNLLLFCILFVFTATRNLKDIFIQKYAIFGGTELISSLKTLFVLPITFVITMLLSAFINKSGMKRIFYVVCSFYGVFFLIFAFFIFPNVNSIQVSEDAVLKLFQSFPSQLRYIILCIINWPYTIFYIFAETWGSIALNYLFWSLANQITKKNEVTRFYALYLFFGNNGGLLAGACLYLMSNTSNRVVFDNNLKLLCIISSVFCFLIMGIYYYISKVVMKDEKLYDTSQIESKKEKLKIGFFEGIKILFTNPYVFLIFMLPVCCGIGINLYEGIFKAYLATTFDVIKMSKLQGMLLIFTTIFTVILNIAAVHILRKYSWKTNALIMPTILTITVTAFYLLIFYVKTSQSNISYILGLSIPILTVWVGIIVDIFSKGATYCLFDPTKSMVYIPLDKQIKEQSQAAVELIGGKGGKAGGGLITMLILAFSSGSTLLDHIPMFLVLFLMVMLAWIFSVIKLSKEYERKKTQ